MVSKVLMENSVKINRFVIPKFLFYAVLSSVFLIVEFTLLRPVVANCTAYCFAIAVIAIFITIFCFETARVWLKGSL